MVMVRFLKGLGIFVALVAVGIVSAFAVVALLLRQEEVRTPGSTPGQNIVTVIDMVAQQGLQLKVGRREAHPTLPRDAIISQSPRPGAELRGQAGARGASLAATPKPRNWWVSTFARRT